MVDLHGNQYTLYYGTKNNIPNNTNYMAVRFLTKMNWFVWWASYIILCRGLHFLRNLSINSLVNSYYYVSNLHPGLAPSSTTTSLELWIEQSNGIISSSARKPWSALVQLVWCSLWNERNARIFRNQPSPPRTVVERLLEEAAVWQRAERGKAISLLNRPREAD